MSTHKIIFVGDANVGKTTYITKIRNNQFDYKYLATMAVEVHQLKVGVGNDYWNIWDCAGDDQLKGFSNEYYSQAKGALIFCDITNIKSIINLYSWVKKIRKIVNNIHIVIVATHCDEHDINNPLDKNVKTLNKLSKSLNIKIVIISSLDNTNLYLPITC